jgi:hypothetical protein
VGDQTLIRFALDSLPGGTVRSAKLHFWLFASPPPPTTIVTATEVREAWSEGSGDFALGFANHLDRQPGVPWTTPGAEAPGSRDPTAIASAELPTVVDAELVLDLPVELVNRWVATPAQNHGLALLCEAQYVELYSSDNPIVERRPLLVITLGP